MIITATKPKAKSVFLCFLIFIFFVIFYLLLINNFFCFHLRAITFIAIFFLANDFEGVLRFTNNASPHR